MNAILPPPDARTEMASLTFDELEIGQTASISRDLTVADLTLFAIVSGNVDPLHFPGGPASRFRTPVGHVMRAGSLFSGLLGTRSPGLGTIYLEQASHSPRLPGSATASPPPCASASRPRPRAWRLPRAARSARR